MGYFTREGVRGIFLHGFMSFASVCVTVACLIIMGTFCLVLLNLNQMILRLEQENEVLVYVDENYSEAEARSVGSYINMVTNVYNAKFISKDEALDNFVEKQGKTELFGGLDSSTLRDRYEITLTDSTKMRETVALLEQIDGVVGVTAHYEIMEGFSTVQQVLRVASTIIIAVLFVVSLLIVSNTIRLALYDRREEIAIMRVVGATNHFIRTPYVIEGILLGLFGAALAFFAEWGIYNLLAVRISAVDTFQLVELQPFEMFRDIMIVLYAIAGFLIGLFGSLLSIRKFLKV
ncbi:MAG: permease-like cell division protein FtsX [Oscillospiraceae bacterium]|nr:permease-like cell division protein FtsX [Oscillospiraceae bacterium]